MGKVEKKLLKALLGTELRKISAEIARICKQGNIKDFCHQTIITKI
ncbi:MAG: hypothetical protein PHV66_01425 [Bacteroidales bacterium]|nr:hypothetical protein [Bacteroidales bacterium]